ncbi:response regulator transcription factor [Cytobacillus oceanisediminis]|uniref:response regulator transcription factor n=1 Tax=Bacillaceae TaxID=186817 RepID=UPI001CCB6ABB|nr:response regulator transcription factor [Cytobacillus oceanisediminis]MBZ9533309.1 response regulator transcription factor [Cytobacillus oceanisediminis]MDU1846416.1 response regulator transcription factor [Niallia nealsonii]
MSLTGLAEKKILLVDDEVDILNLLETVLRKDGFQRIEKATTGQTGISLCEKFNPDIIVLDIMLPDIEGYEVCQKMREITFAPIIFLSAKSEEIDKLLGLGIGGDDYVTKPFSTKELVFRIKAQLRRNQYMVQSRHLDGKITFGNILISPNTGEVKKGENPITLTAKELQLLVYLAKHPNQIFSKSKICEAVWGEDFIGLDNTIMVHIRRLREKIEEDPSNPKWIKTVKGLGYKLQVRGNEG